MATTTTTTTTGGENVTMTVSGNTRDGCRFVSMDLTVTVSCCYSALARGETLCDPRRQDSRCRNKSTFRVEEAEEACILHLYITNLTDSGKYLVVFPGKLSDNKWVKLDVVEKEVVEETTEIVLQEVAESTAEVKTVKAGAVGEIIITVIVLVIVLTGIGLVVFKWKKVKEWWENGVGRKGKERESDQDRVELGESDETDGPGGKVDLVERIQGLEKSVRMLEESLEIQELRRIVESQQSKIEMIERRLDGGLMID